MLDEMVTHGSRCLSSWDIFNEAFNGEFHSLIKRTEIKDRKYGVSTLSKTEFEKIRKEREFEGDWKWDNKLKKYVWHYPILGEYVPIEKKVILYVKNIEEVCDYYGVPFYCGVLTTFIHELFHAVHHVEASERGKRYYCIREIEEAVTEFSTLVFLKEMVDDKPRSDEWKQTFDWALRSIRAKQDCLGDLPAYGFGYYLFSLLCNPTAYYDEAFKWVEPDEAYKWINKYNEKIGCIGKKNRVKKFKQMLNPAYPKDEQACLELLHSILFNL